MEAMLALRIATLSTPLHLTLAPYVRSSPVNFPKCITLHSRTLAQLAAMDLKPSHKLAFTRVPGTSTTWLFTDHFTMKKWFTQLTWTWHIAITPTRLLVLLTDMTILIKTRLCPTREDRGLCLLMSDPLQLNGTIQTTTPTVSHDKW